MAWSYIQSNSSANGATGQTSWTQAFSGPTTPGNLLPVVILAGARPTTVNDSEGNVYAPMTGGTPGSYLYWATARTAGTPIVTFGFGSFPAAQTALGVAEFHTPKGFAFSNDGLQGAWSSPLSAGPFSAAGNKLVIAAALIINGTPGGTVTPVSGTVALITIDSGASQYGLTFLYGLNQAGTGSVGAGYATATNGGYAAATFVEGSQGGAALLMGM